MARSKLLITGIAEGLGAEIAGTFSKAGYDVVGLSRTKRALDDTRALVERAGGNYIHLVCDLTRPDEVSAALGTHIEDIEVLIHNAQLLMIKPFGEVSVEDFEQVWRTCCLGAMIAAQLVVPQMASHKRGCLIFTGATAGLRGGANFSAFASAKFALRGLAQALAREFGPRGVHIAHIVIDGLIDAPQTDQRFGHTRSGRMDPKSIAKSYLELVLQNPTAWTQEMDLRPFAEKF